MDLGTKLQQHLGHYRETIIRSGSKKFDEADLTENVDDVMVRMMEIVFEQENIKSWNELIEEAIRDCEVKESISS